MKKRWILLLIPVPVLFIAFILLRMTGGFQIHSIPTLSNDPTIPIGKIVFTSTLKKPTAGNFITFKSEYSDPLSNFSTVGQTFIFRIIAVEGDIVNMKDGVCFVNNRNIDKDLNLYQNYIINGTVLQQLQNIKELQSKSYLTQLSDSLYEVFLTTTEAGDLANKGYHLNKVIYKEPNADVFNWMGKDAVWTLDNFGSLKIPAGFYFVLGDNRHNALDSRYTGFVKKESFMGTALNLD